jgi:hypothetical protein
MISLIYTGITSLIKPEKPLRINSLKLFTEIIEKKRMIKNYKKRFKWKWPSAMKALLKISPTIP